MKYFAITLLSIFASRTIIFAQNIPEKDSSSNLLEVIVTATRKVHNIATIPYSVNTLAANDINENQSRTTPEALIGLTGIFIQKTNHGGGSPFLRGLTGNQTLLMIDGIRLNNATFRFGPNQYLNTIDAYTISKIEVARGTGSVQYGSDALGGVIQIFSKEPILGNNKKLSANFIGKAATHNMEYTGRASIEYQSKKVGFIIGYTNRNFGDIIGGDSTGKQTPTGYKEQALDAKIKWQLNNKTTLIAAHQYLQQKDAPLYHRVRLENFAYYNFSPQSRSLSYLKLLVDVNKKVIDKITFTTSYQSILEKRVHQKNNSTLAFVEEDKVKVLGISADAVSVFSKKWTSNTGIEFYHDKVQSSKQQTNTVNNITVMQRGLYPNDAVSNNLSIYHLQQISINKISVEAGLRYNLFSIKIPDTATSSYSLGNVVVKPSSLVSNVAVAYAVNPQQTLYASFNTGYRTPNIDDMGTLGLVDFRFEVPAYNLAPEKTYNSEIGYKYSNKKLRTNIAFFYMHLANIITRVQIPGQQIGGYNVYTKQNSQSGFIRGFETDIAYQLSTQFKLSASMAYTFGENMSRNEPLRRIPPLNGNIALQYRKSCWYSIINCLYASTQNRLAQGDKDDNRIPSGGTPGFQIINFTTGYNYQKYAIKVGIQNILNQDYRTHGSGINGVGRSGWLALEIHL